MIDLTQPFEARAEAMLTRVFRGMHHCGHIVKHPGTTPYWEVVQHGTLATFDYDLLTRLVLGAHEYCLRVEIHKTRGGIGIQIANRKSRDGDFWERHPTIEQAIAKWNEPLS